MQAVDIEAVALQRAVDQVDVALAVAEDQRAADLVLSQQGAQGLALVALGFSWGGTFFLCFGL